MAIKNFASFPRLQTVRLSLRPLAETDCHEIFLLRSDSAVNKFLERPRARSIEDARSFIENIQEGTKGEPMFYWAITEQGKNQLIGTICLFHYSEDNHSFEIGFELLPAMQGKGIMQEAVQRVIDLAFRELGLHTMVAEVHIQNKASIRLLERFRFLRDGEADGDFLKMKLLRTGFRQ